MACAVEAGLTVSDLPLHIPGSVPAKVTANRLVTAAVALAIVLAGALGGWITPSIPIPPPEPSEMRFPIDTAAGTAPFSYGPEINFAGALVYVYNRSREVGVIAHARADGSVGPWRDTSTV